MGQRPATGVSLHIGLNRVDPVRYGGWFGQLAGCQNDARAMQEIADQRGLSSTLLLDEQATADAVLAWLRDAARTLVSGDLLVLTYAGHGAQVPDENGDEADGQDETWVLFDRQLLDDELYAAYGLFRRGVRIAVVSDSCHSGTVAQDLRSSPSAQRAYDGHRPNGHLRSRAMPINQQTRDVGRRYALYRELQQAHPNGDLASIGASVILLGGCQDNQLAADGDVYGLFTEKLLALWEQQEGSFARGYRQLWRMTSAIMPSVQSPSYVVLGAANATFEGQNPFSL